MHERVTLVDVLFLRSFPDQFQRVFRNKKEKQAKNYMKMLIFRKIVYLKKHMFPRFSLMINVQEDLRNNKSIESGLISAAVAAGVRENTQLRDRIQR